MEFNDFCSTLQLSDELISKITPFQEELMANSNEDFPSFMEKEFYEKYLSWCQITELEEILEKIEQVADLTRKNPYGARYASMLYYYFFGGSELKSIPWEEPRAVYGENTGIFNLLLALCALPRIRSKHEEMGLDEAFTRNQALWVKGSIELYRVGNNGAPGFFLHTVYWLNLGSTGELIRIGRLEFLPRKYSAGLPYIYQNNDDGRLAVLCRDQWAFNKDGLRVEPDSAEAVFVSSFKADKNCISGTPVTPYGFPETDKVVKLDPAKWTLVQNDEDEVVTVHIPGGGGMTLESVREALIGAKKFYREKLGQELKLFVCESWIFDPVWEKEMPDSNIAAFERNVYLTPCHIYGVPAALFFLYGDYKCDPRKREIQSSIHRACCRIVERGGNFRVGGMFILSGDVEKMGTEPYRK